MSYFIDFGQILKNKHIFFTGSNLIFLTNLVLVKRVSFLTIFTFFGALRVYFDSIAVRKGVGNTLVIFYLLRGRIVFVSEICSALRASINPVRIVTILNLFTRNWNFERIIKIIWFKRGFADRTKSGQLSI